MQRKIKELHIYIANIFYLLTRGLLSVFILFGGITSWMYPVVKIWTDLIDKEFSLMSSIIYIFIGISLFYISLALDKINSDLNKLKSK